MNLNIIKNYMYISVLAFIVINSISLSPTIKRKNKKCNIQVHIKCIHYYCDKLNVYINKSNKITSLFFLCGN